MLGLDTLGWAAVILCAIMVGASKTGIPGIGILGVPLMALVIEPAEKSVGALLGMLILADIFAIIYHRHNARWAHALRMLPPAFAGIVAAYFGLRVLPDKEKLKPIARIVRHASFSHEPEWFTTAPIGAVRHALHSEGLTVHDIDLFEINEAFSAVTMAAIRDLEIDESKVNVHGGAVALGHPIGASGARILVTLLYEMKRRGAKRGLATLCNGGGEATCIIVEAC